VDSNIIKKILNGTTLRFPMEPPENNQLSSPDMNEWIRPSQEMYLNFI
jgi:hypothetical protein